MKMAPLFSAKKFCLSVNMCLPVRRKDFLVLELMLCCLYLLLIKVGPIQKKAEIKTVSLLPLFCVEHIS